MSQKEEKIKKLCTDYIFNETKTALMLYILNRAEDMLKPDTEQKCIVPEDVKKIIANADSIFVNIENILDSSDKKEAAFEKCIGLKKQITDIYKAVYSYYVQWNIVATPIGDENALRRYKSENTLDKKKINLDMFYKDCYGYIKSAPTVFAEKSRIGKLIKCLPLKMTKDRYFDLVRRSLDIAFAGESEQAISLSLETFINTCAPRSKDTYGKYFPEIAELLENKAQIKAAGLTDAELDNVYTDLSAAFELLQDIEDMCQDVFNNINSLIILLFAGFGFDDLSQDNPEYSDVYYKCAELLSRDDDFEKAAFAQPLKEMAEEYAERLIDETNAISKREMEFIEKHGKADIEEDDTRKIIASEGFIRDCFYGDLNEEIFNFNLNDSLPPADESFKKVVFDNFLDTVRKDFSTLPNAVRKAAMLSLLGSLPIDMTAEETVSFIEYTAESESKPEGKLLIIDKAGMVFGEDGYNDDECACGHHHHDHDCDCGHHHHDHDCGCGHHHHDHDCGCGHHH